MRLLKLRMRYHQWRAGRASDIGTSARHITAAIVLADRLGVAG